MQNVFKITIEQEMQDTYIRIYDLVSDTVSGRPVGRSCK